MKKILVISLLGLSLFSCQQPELEFSCDPVINKFIVENKEELSTITVQKLGFYDFQLQKAIFKSWDYQKKRNAWVDKLRHVKSNIPLTDLEKSHIQALIEHIDENYFLMENLDKNSEIRLQFASQWVDYANSKLGWKNQFIAFMVYRLYTGQSQFENELSALRVIETTSSSNSESGNCDCNGSSDFCGSVDCHTGGCSITQGCGWLWSMPCDGRCY